MVPMIAVDCALRPSCANYWMTLEPILLIFENLVTHPSPENRECSCHYDMRRPIKPMYVSRQRKRKPNAEAIRSLLPSFPSGRESVGIG